jgi:hypothetical protein
VKDAYNSHALEAFLVVVVGVQLAASIVEVEAAVVHQCFLKEGG